MASILKGWRRIAFACFLSVVPWTAFAGQVAITMDDLDLHAEDVIRLTLDQRNEAILKALKDAGIKAAIFVCGMRVDNPEGMARLQQWGRAGHLIGNHTYSHVLLGRLSADDFIRDAARNEALLAGKPGYTKLFRFPALKEGQTAAQRDQVRAYLHAQGYRMGYVTIDTSDWAIDQRLRDRLRKDPTADLAPYRDFYLAHIWDRAQYYDRLARAVLGRSPKHTLLVHSSLLNALFLPDLLRMFRDRGWTLIDVRDAFSDAVFSREPAIAPAGESLIWALAKETGRFEDQLRYPGEDDTYERAAMDARGL